jgi:hypothetical protein
MLTKTINRSCGLVNGARGQVVAFTSSGLPQVMCVCLCVCVESEREKKREREKETKRERESEKEIGVERKRPGRRFNLFRSSAGCVCVCV